MVLTLVGKNTAGHIAVAEITEAFIKRFGKADLPSVRRPSAAHPLCLATYIRHGNFVLPTTQGAHLLVLAERYGIDVKDTVAPK